MKTRMDFVTNSSSSSFIVRKNGLTDEQIAALKNINETVNKLGKAGKFVAVHNEKILQPTKYDPENDVVLLSDWYETVENYTLDADGWYISEETDEFVEFYTIMDNFDIEDVFKLLHIPVENYEWGGEF